MEKIAVIGDVHFNRKAEHPIIRTNIKEGQKKFFNALPEELKKRGVKTVLLTGDLHDTRNVIDVEALVNTKRVLQNQLKDFDIHIILGNHDLYYENSYDISALELFEDIPNVTIYRDMVSKVNLLGKNWYMFPWILGDKEEKSVEFLKKLGTKPNDNNVIFGHFDMLGIDMEGNGEVSVAGFDHNLFLKAAKLTLSGHYHGQSVTENTNGKLIYVGSPYPLTFANTESKHGFWTVDEELNTEFIENTLSPTFKDIWDTDDLENLGDLSNSFVRLYLSNALSAEELFKVRTKVEGKNPLKINKIPYGGNKEETNKKEIQTKANQLLAMDTIKMSEMYIDLHEDELPELELSNDSRQAVLDRVGSYKEELNI